MMYAASFLRLSRRSRPTRDLGLRPVEELNSEAHSLPDAERIFAEVDEECRQMVADQSATS